MHLARPLALAPLLLLFACDKNGGDTDSDTGPDTGDTGSSGGTDQLPEGMAPLAELSSGECPDLSTSGTSSFVSSGEERTVTVVVPSDPSENMRVVFFFHGLMDPSSTPNPTDYTASALGLQTLADTYDTLFVLPESDLWEVFGYSFFLWDILEEDDHDLVLLDDLRTCLGDPAYSPFDVDLSDMHAMGFSGGALFSTLVLRERADILASVVEYSGGSDVEVALLGATVAHYETPAQEVPVLMTSGGMMDTYPQGGGFTLVNFEEATNNLEASLATDGIFAVRCSHDMGHTVPPEGLEVGTAWITSHRFGEESPFQTDGIDELGDWCALAQ